MRNGSFGQPLQEQDINELKDLVLQLGEREVATSTGIARSVLARCLAGLGLRRGTHALVKQALSAAREAKRSREIAPPAGELTCQEGTGA